MTGLLLKERVEQAEGLTDGVITNIEAVVACHRLVHGGSRERNNIRVQVACYPVKVLRRDKERHCRALPPAMSSRSKLMSLEY